jgi:3-phosphoshikimate 1-carboxyvinyltransferase
MFISVSRARALRGVVSVPGDKSIAHRAILCGALASGWTRIAGVPRSADVDATIRAVGELGIQAQRNGDAVIVQGLGRGALRSDAVSIDCANSGTTMRLLMAILAGQSGTSQLVGDASLSRRPMRRVAEPLALMGAQIALQAGGTAPVTIAGRALHAIEYALPIPSAQLKSALLFAALSAEGTTRLEGEITSRDHLERMLPLFGVELDCSLREIRITGGQDLRGAFVAIPGDPSSAAYWLAAAAISPNADVEVHNVGLNRSRLGFVNALRGMGAVIEIVQASEEPEPAGSIRIRSAQLRAVQIDAPQIPGLVDELPLLAVVASQAEGTTVVRGASELRVKESDRIDATAAMLRSLGAEIETFEDGFAIEGPQRLTGGYVDPRSDHRIAMAAGIAGLVADKQTAISQPQCVGVSYPQFFSTLSALGAEVA